MYFTLLFFIIRGISFVWYIDRFQLFFNPNIGCFLVVIWEGKIKGRQWNDILYLQLFPNGFWYDVHSCFWNDFGDYGKKWRGRIAIWKNIRKTFPALIEFFTPWKPRLAYISMFSKAKSKDPQLKQLSCRFQCSCSHYLTTSSAKALLHDIWRPWWR